ncbi:MAG TPA: transposase [Gammaproteobacteria bacterium]|nr:transposase [Gammaproteobacteria bacterium]
MKKDRNYPGIIDKTEFEISEIIAYIKNSELPESVKDFVIKCIESALWFPMFLEKKNISLRRLRTMIFGKGYGKKKNKSKVKNEEMTQSKNAISTSDMGAIQNILPQNTDEIVSTEEKTPSQNNATSKPGHGRMPNTVYQDCEEIRFRLQGLTIGSECPLKCGGKLGYYKPGAFIRIKGQNFAKVLRYTIDKLRCNLCDYLVAAEIPPEVGAEKYDASFKAMLAILKYYVAIPFYRQENFQRMLNFPLSDATQWTLVEQLASVCYLVFNVLKTWAANGNVLNNDDTKLIILEVVKAIKAGVAGKRTGMYTTGIIAENAGHQIALFINGRQHSGENVRDILKLRTPEKEPIIQMCDALSANIPKEMQTILCNCLSHGFRRFEELVDYFSEECLYIMKMLSQVYEYDKLTKDMAIEERLAYHQEHSKPVMDELLKYMSALLTERKVEPNSELGGAIKYMQKHWLKLTRFLSVAGAPIDNNIVERALKIAIRNRKSAMFYRTNYSAYIGGMLTSLIYTCHLAKENPHHYLTELQNHKEIVSKNPEQWLPWNYRKTMTDCAANDANSQGHSPPLDYPVAA